jgi:ABC-type uncharacterized transport system permease subunit
MIADMTLGTVHGLLALLSLVPAAMLGLRRSPARDGLFWGCLALALAGPAALSVDLLGDHWVTGLSPTLWISIAAAVVVALASAALMAEAWRLVALLGPYLLILGLIAAIWLHTIGAPLAEDAPDAWVGLHIGVGVTTYGLLTVAAMAALAAFVQERALKRKRPTRLSRQVPAVAESEIILSRLLLASEAVLGLGLSSGMAVEWMESGRLLALDHKTLLSVLAFLTIGALLVARHVSGMRGRAAARVVLLAYLLLTLAYPGVKFVTGVLAT